MQIETKRNVRTKQLRSRAREQLRKISEIERALEAELLDWERQLTLAMAESRNSLMQEIKDSANQIREDVLESPDGFRLRSILSTPVIYAMIVPIAFMDLCFSFYQAVCFRLYGIARVDRSKFMAIDRQHLAYLNPIEKLNCMYCGYSNGVLAFAREIAARTEQYWCPIKHARRVLGTHDRYAAFLQFGDPEAFEDSREALRSALKSSQDAPSSA